MACYDCALQYAQFRKQFHDQPIASHQLVQEKLVWMISEITKAQLLALQVGRLKDQGKAKAWHVSMAKRNNVWMALECARMARDILAARLAATQSPNPGDKAGYQTEKSKEEISNENRSFQDPSTRVSRCRQCDQRIPCQLCQEKGRTVGDEA